MVVMTMVRLITSSKSIPIDCLLSHLPLYLDQCQQCLPKLEVQSIVRDMEAKSRDKDIVLDIKVFREVPKEVGQVVW